MVALLAIPFLCALAVYWASAHYVLERPVLGVFDQTDLWVLASAIVLLPLQYWLIPAIANSILFGLVVLNSIYILSRALRKRSLRVIVSVASVIAVCLLHTVHGSDDSTTVWANNLLLALTIVSVATVWVQAGMTAHHTTILCTGLTIFDLAATSLFGFMAPLADNLANTTPSAIFQLPHGQGGLGLGDVLIATIIPATFRRTHGTRYACWALITTLAAFGIAFAIPTRIFPVMATLGPLTIALHYRAAHRSRTPNATADPALSAPIGWKRHATHLGKVPVK